MLAARGLCRDHPRDSRADSGLPRRSADPRFPGPRGAAEIVLDAQPDVLNHNTETVPRLYRAVRSGARYQRTLDLLENAKKFSPGMVTKSGVMVGLGESSEELIEVFRDLGTRGVDILTVGSICGRRKIICRSRASTLRKNSSI